MDENKCIELLIPGEPIAQPRQRHAARMVHGNIMSMNYVKKDSPIHAFKAALQIDAAGKWIGPPSQNPFIVNIVATFSRPKNMIWKKREMPRKPKMSKPDLDNLMKAVFDGLNKIVWQDDSQIFEVTMKKEYAAGDEQPGTMILIREQTI